MAVAPATDVRLHPLSVEDYHRMIEAEILTEDDSGVDVPRWTSARCSPRHS